MVALQERTEKKSALGLPFLRAIASKEAPAPPPKRRSRWLTAACVVVNSIAIAAGAALMSAPTPAPVVEAAPTQQSSLFEQLASDEYAQFELSYQEEKTERLQAEAIAAQQQADRAKRETDNQVALLRSYADSDVVLDKEKGDEIKTTTLVKVECRSSNYGWDAFVTQVEGKFQNGVIGHLASCRAGEHKPGDVIGVVGAQQPSIKNGFD